MIKKTMYPKTQRLKIDGDNIQITEKLDGSNLILFKKKGELYIGQRSGIILFMDIDKEKDKLYKGLYQWLKDNGDFLKENLNDGSALCGEWLGMGIVKYDKEMFNKKFYMFAKANIDDDFNLYNLIYEHNLFIYPFINQEVPAFIGIVPIVDNIKVLPNKDILDKMYDLYRTQQGDREVEGFVINYNNFISKYVRMKNGKLVDYSDKDHKGM